MKRYTSVENDVDSYERVKSSLLTTRSLDRDHTRATDRLLLRACHDAGEGARGHPCARASPTGHIPPHNIRISIVQPSRAGALIKRFIGQLPRASLSYSR